MPGSSSRPGQRFHHTTCSNECAREGPWAQQAELVLLQLSVEQQQIPRPSLLSPACAHLQSRGRFLMSRDILLGSLSLSRRLIAAELDLAFCLLLSLAVEPAP